MESVKRPQDEYPAERVGPQDEYPAERRAGCSRVRTMGRHPFLGSVAGPWRGGSDRRKLVAAPYGPATDPKKISPVGRPRTEAVRCDVMRNADN